MAVGFAEVRHLTKLSLGVEMQPISLSSAVHYLGYHRYIVLVLSTHSLSATIDMVLYTVHILAYIAILLSPLFTSAFISPISFTNHRSKINAPTSMFATKTKRTTSDELIPREILFGNPENISPTLSPDGKYLAYLAPS